MDSPLFASILFDDGMQREDGRIEFEPGFLNQVGGNGLLDDPQDFARGLRLQN